MRDLDVPVGDSPTTRDVVVGMVIGVAGVAGFWGAMAPITAATLGPAVVIVSAPSGWMAAHLSVHAAMRWRLAREDRRERRGR